MSFRSEQNQTSADCQTTCSVSLAGVGKILVAMSVSPDAESSYKAFSEDTAVKSAAIVPVVSLFESHS